MPSASTCSPYMPRPRLAAVMPSCAVAMYRSCSLGSWSTRCTARASVLPPAARRSIAARGAPTMANSAATKTPFSRISAVMISSAITSTAPAATSGLRPAMIVITVSASTTSISTSTPSITTCSPVSGTRPMRWTTKAADRLDRGAPLASDQERRLIEPHHPRDPQASVREANRAELRALELVRHAAEQLTDDVLERDESRDGAALIDDDRLVAAPLAQEPEQPIGGHRVGHAHDRAQQRRHIQRSVLHVPRDHVLGVQDADDVVHRSAVDRQPAVRARRDDARAPRRSASRRRPPPGARAAPSTGAPCAGRAAARDAAAPARAARAGRRRGSRRSAARSPRASARGDDRSPGRASASAAARRCR